MSTKKLVVLSLVFLGLLAFVVFYERFQPTSEEAAQARRRLLDFKSEDVTAIAIERPDLPDVQLVKSGARWTLAGEKGGAADATTVDALVADLARLEVVGETRAGFDAKEFGLDKPKAKVKLSFRKGEPKTVLFGLSVPGTDATAAAEGKRFGAVKFAPNTSLTKPLDEFRSKSLFEGPSSEITRLTIVKGPSKVVVAREGTDADAEWRMEVPVKDLAAKSFVQRLLSDLASARVSEFPSVPPSDLPKIGLQPPSFVVTLQKGAEIVSTIALGAGKAETTGKLYAKRDNLVVVVDDRFQEDLSKELTAFRETKLFPLDSWTVSRVSYQAGGSAVGAERIEGEWRSAGRTVAAGLAEALIEKFPNAESKGFVSKKDYVARGIQGRGEKKPLTLGVLDVTKEKTSTPVTFTVFDVKGSNPPQVAIEVTGRTEAMLVEKSVFMDLAAAAERLREAASAAPTPPPTRAARTPAAALVSPGATVAPPVATPAVAATKPLRKAPSPKASAVPVPAASEATPTAPPSN